MRGRTTEPQCTPAEPNASSGTATCVDTTVAPLTASARKSADRDRSPPRGTTVAVRPHVTAAELHERRAELLEQIREAQERIGWLQAELKVLKRPKGLLATIRALL